jgi:hypothetical protein
LIKVRPKRVPVKQRDGSIRFSRRTVLQYLGIGAAATPLAITAMGQSQPAGAATTSPVVGTSQLAFGTVTAVTGSLVAVSRASSRMPIEFDASAAGVVANGAPFMLGDRVMVEFNESTSQPIGITRQTDQYNGVVTQISSGQITVKTPDRGIRQVSVTGPFLTIAYPYPGVEAITNADSLNQGDTLALKTKYWPPSDGEVAFFIARKS